MNPPAENPRPAQLSKPWVRSALYLMVGYVGLVSMLLFFENWLVFHPTTEAQNWVPKPAPEIEDVQLTSADGTRIHAWWLPAKGSDQALLYCHGNAGNLSHRGGTIVQIRELLGVSVLILDYPGYGKSEGSPTERGCYAATDAAYDWLTDKQNIVPKKILLYGASLGGGVITDLASRKDHRALILVKTFTSMPDIASDLYWWLPAPKRLLMRNRFDSLGKIGSIRRPVFIAHGTRDTLIPYAHGEKLFQAANEPKQMFSMADADHNTSLPPAFFTSLNAFLRKNPIE